MLMIAGWVFMFMGYFWGAGLPLWNVSLPFDLRFWIAFASYSCEMGAVYVMNQIRDVDSDRANRKILILPEGLVSLRAAWWWVGCQAVVSACLAPLAGPWFLAIWVVSGIFGFLYSGPPNLKGRAIPNIILNMAGYGLVAFLAGWAVARPLNPWALWYALPYILGDGAVTAGTIIPDIPGDIATGEQTIGTRYGARATAWFGFICCAGAVAGGILTRDFIIAVASGLSLPLFALSAFRTTDFAVKFSYRIASFVLALFVGIRFPVFGVLCIAIFFYARFYNRLRFGITNYPSFTGR